MLGLKLIHVGTGPLDHLKAVWVQVWYLDKKGINEEPILTMN